jgi:hypothetical protein
MQNCLLGSVMCRGISQSYIYNKKLHTSVCKSQSLLFVLSDSLNMCFKYRIPAFVHENPSIIIREKIIFQYMH